MKYVKKFQNFKINEDFAENENFPFLNYIHTSLSDEFKVSVPKNTPNMVAIKVAKGGTEQEMDVLSPQIGLSYRDELGIEQDVLRNGSSWNGISGNLREFEILDIYDELENIKRLCDEYNCKLLFTINDTSVLGEMPSDKLIAAVNARAAGKAKTRARIKDAKTSVFSPRYYSFEDLMKVQDEIIFLTIYIYK